MGARRRWQIGAVTARLITADCAGLIGAIQRKHNRWLSARVLADADDLVAAVCRPTEIRRGSGVDARTCLWPHASHTCTPVLLPLWYHQDKDKTRAAGRPDARALSLGLRVAPLF